MPGNKGSRRRFGSVRRLRSGRWQARYLAPDGRTVAAPHTFDRKGDAERWLTHTEADLMRGDWLDPEAGRVPFGEYATSWVEERDLSETTRERYEGVLRKYLLPTFGNRGIGEIKEAEVRRWRHERLREGTGSPTVAKSYRLLRAIFNTAVDDGLARRNPCRIKGAGEDLSSERPVLTVDEVYAVADAITPRYRVLVLLATFTSLRFGELAALRRDGIDLDAQEVRVRSSQAELRQGRIVVKAPKSEAGRRTVAIPAVIMPEVRRHLEWFAARERDGLVFVGPMGGVLRRRNFQRLWTRALQEAGLGDRGAHFHDLRHTGNHLAAATGASTRELMARMGHSSLRAALIYQHATRERDRAIADAVSANVTAARRPKRRSESAPDQAVSDPSGTTLAREP